MGSEIAQDMLLTPNEIERLRAARKLIESVRARRTPRA
jgi:hypothetical protein